MLSICFCESEAAYKFLTLRNWWLYGDPLVIHSEVSLDLIECIGYWTCDTLNPGWDELLSYAVHTRKSATWGAVSMIDFLSFRWFFRINTSARADFLIGHSTRSTVWRARCSKAGTVCLLSLKAVRMYLNFVSMDFVIGLSWELFPGNGGGHQS